MERVRIGLVGAGLIGGVHSAALQGIAAAWPERVELTAVADPRRESREQFVAAYGYRQAFTNAADLLDHAEVDAVFVCTPTAFHAEVVQAAAAAGAHIFCEKPLAMSLDQAREMLDAVQRAGVKTQIGLVLRFSPVYTVMRELLHTSGAGDPIAVLFRDDQCFPIRGMHHAAWRKDRSLTAGGTLIEHGVHDLDLLTWLFGPMARLRAWEQNRTGHPGVEDYMAVEIEFDCGLRAQLVNLWHDMVQRPSNRRLEVFCQRGFLASDHDMLGDISIQIGDGELQTIGSDNVKRRFEELIDRRDEACRDEVLRPWYAIPYVLQAVAFVEALLNEQTPAPGLEVGVEAQRLAAAVYTAARTGSEIQVAEFA